MSESGKILLLGIDTGGTFTDYVGLSETGQYVRGKVNSTPDHPDRAIGRILDQLPLSEDCRFVHGTTVATNALLEDDLGDVVFVTNKGLDGLLSIGRGTRPQLYEFDLEPSSVNPFDCEVVTVNLRDHPMAPTKRTLTRKERMDLRQRIGQIDPDVVAVCLVHSYRDADLEETVRDALGDVSVDLVLSSEVLPRFREFERASSTVVNAGLTTVVTNYLERLRKLDTLPADHYLMGSDRGVLEFNEARKRPALTVLSGPAGGVIGSRSFLESEKVDRFVSMDMGGTSTEVAAVDGEVPLRDDHEIGGYDLAFPMVDIHTVGSGGGSIIWIDQAGSLRVGPRSAGANPGPACYGHGGPPTLTDAQLVLGRIPRTRSLSDDLTLELQPARTALEKLATELGMSLQAISLGALKLARTRLVEAVRSITVRRGRKPSTFSLIAHGGAGGLFASSLADQLNINPVYVPRRGGVASAAGLLTAPKFAQRSVSPLQELRSQSRIPGMDRLLDREPDWANESVELFFEGECRFKGQTHTIGIDFSDTTLEAVRLRESFLEEYEEQYGYQPEEERVELVHLNGYWRSSFDRTSISDGKPRKPSVDLPEQSLVGDRGSETVDVKELETLKRTVEGPDLLSGSTTTVYLPRGWSAEPVNDRLVKLQQ